MRYILVFLSFFLQLLRADDHTIAVLNFSGEGVHEDELRSLSEQFRVELLKMDTLKVLSYDDMTFTLSNFGYEKATCFTVECGVIISMLLDQEWLVDAHITKIGDAFLVEGRLFDSKTGRILNAISYDYELSIDGLYEPGMHNLAELIMSKRIPLEVHQRKNLVYFKTNPAGAMVRVGRDTLNGLTPMAINRVTVESRPIILLKEGYEPYRVKQLPNNNSDVLSIELQRLVPLIGNVIFDKKIPKDISISLLSSQDRFLIKIDETRVDKLPAGKYKLTSDIFIIPDPFFTIKHRTNTKKKLVIYKISEIEKRRDSYKIKRDIFLSSVGAGISFRGYLALRSNDLYSKYSAQNEKSDFRHSSIESLDSQKFGADIFYSIMIFPSIYYHAKFLEMNRWLIN